MFETELKDKLQKIFDFTKATFAEPGESQEQNVLFIEVQNAQNKVTDKVFKSRVTGQVTVFGIYERLPFGYFSKCIDKADPELKKDLFFFDFEANTKIFQDKVQRTFNFIYLFSGQYDPDLGSIDSIEIEEQN